VLLQNLKGLTDLSELQWAPALEEFILLQGESQQLDDLLPLLSNPSLRRAVAYFGSAKRNERFAQLLTERGIGKYEFTPFQYS